MAFSNFGRFGRFVREIETNLFSDARINDRALDGCPEKSPKPSNEPSNEPSNGPELPEKNTRPSSVDRPKQPNRPTEPDPYNRARDLAREAEALGIDLVDYLKAHAPDLLDAPTDPEDTICKAHESEVDRIARLDAERNAADKVASRGYDYAPPDSVHGTSFFPPLRMTIDLRTEAAGVTYDPINPDDATCEVCGDPAGLIVPANAAVKGKRHFCGLRCYKQARENTHAHR